MRLSQGAAVNLVEDVFDLQDDSDGTLTVTGALAGDGLTVEVHHEDADGWMEITLRRSQVQELVTVLQQWLSQ